jgi:hypothetical protein
MISIDWVTGIISVPKGDLTLVQSSPSEIRNMDINWFRLQLKDLEDDPNEGMAWTDTHRHNTEVLLGGLTYARVVEILDPYTITFEDGQWAVNLIGANSNVGDKVNVNQVSVRGNNSAGLITSSEIQHAIFNDVVTLDIDNGYSGTVYPIGTPIKPVNNIEDAIIIANYRGFKVINLLSELTVTTGQNINTFTLRSDSWINVTVEPGAVLDNTNFEKISLYGEMSGLWNVLIDCWVYDITNFCGWMRGGSFVNIALAPYNVDSAGQSFFDSILPMYPNEPSVLTFNTDTFVSFTNANDVYQMNEMTDGCILSFGLGSGKIIIDDTCIGGDIFISGIGELVNNSNLVIEESLLINTAHIVEAIDMDSNVGKITTRKAIKAGNILTVYESDNITVWKQFDLSNGGRVEV